MHCAVHLPQTPALDPTETNRFGSSSLENLLTRLPDSQIVSLSFFISKLPAYPVRSTNAPSLVPFSSRHVARLCLDVYSNTPPRLGMGDA
jgi:hypothetical protein